jgi:hypothetical protein
METITIHNRQNLINPIDLVCQIKKSDIVLDIIKSTHNILLTIDDENYNGYDLRRLIEYLQSIENNQKVLLKLYDDFSTYIDDVYFPTDNKYVDINCVLEILTPHYVKWMK